MEETNAFKSVGARMCRKIHPFCENLEWGSDAYWECYVRSLVHTAYHPSSTCKMGDPADPTVVVDPQLRYVPVRRHSYYRGFVNLEFPVTVVK